MVRSRRTHAPLLFATAMVLTAPTAAFALGPDVSVSIDEASMLRLQRPAAEIIIGNPSIADVSVQSGNCLLYTSPSPRDRS